MIDESIHLEDPIPEVLAVGEDPQLQLIHRPSPLSFGRGCLIVHRRGEGGQPRRGPDGRPQRRRRGEPRDGGVPLRARELSPHPPTKTLLRGWCDEVLPGEGRLPKDASLDLHPPSRHTPPLGPPFPQPWGERAP